MKKLMFWAAAVALGVPLCSTGATCLTGTLSDYVALGGAGCTIGTNTLFDFRILSGTAGGTEISGTGVSLIPLGGSTDPGLTASVNVSARSGSVLETLFTYKITGSSYVSSSLTLANSSETGTGDVTGLENLCIGGTFGPSGTTGCTGTPRTLVTVDGVQLQDSTTFSSASLLSITDDFTIDAGLAGTASGGTLTNRFATVPEPSSLLLTAAALLVAGSRRFRLIGARSARKNGEKP